MLPIDDVIEYIEHYILHLARSKFYKYSFGYKEMLRCLTGLIGLYLLPQKNIARSHPPS